MKTLRSVVCVTLLSGLAWAGSVPQSITYQGVLSQNGVPMNGAVTLDIGLTSSDGSVTYWSTGNNQVTVNQGRFSDVLTPKGVDWQNVIPYVQVTVNGQVLASPSPLTASAYALMAKDIIDNAITSAKIATGAVGTLQLANASVTNAQLATNAVQSGNIMDSSITAAKIAMGAVGTGQLANASVTNAQLATNAVQSGNIMDSSITSAKIAMGAVGTGQLANASVTNAQLAANAVQAANINAGAVTSATLDSSVSGSLIPSGMIAMFSTNCPGGWTRFSALDGAFPMGAANYGTQGGSATHTHTFAGTTAGPGDTSSGVVFGSGQGSGSFGTDWGRADHTHAFAGTTETASNIPPYVTMIFCSRN